MYCSRNIIPSDKKKDFIENYKYNIHIGIFVYDYNFLINIYKKINTKIQLTEDIEWMKILELGYKINVIKVDEHEIGVDTNDDYNYLLNKYKN